ncbi:lipopolysaccharide kinase InaA family protein [Pseudomonas nitroreducens]|uniref:lipopolysaccharide kinase InaA family protein n=1 Tax=Pseudomonas nitroreducens TaxID=46680 RepID=UPI00265A56A7|nr:lipopolysaccharide kinase InaA family protein [Pseudomonas nitroreducens]MCP1650612.1 tRNA A-37 threonylcarbamoyl transferase component Bud32 [Pseudomonas nitroreducens]MCP1688564.1 tRNA A-37 threonylcarbamoyl transferase component Bud32 [Pseudomonas nitroreducens]
MQDLALSAYESLRAGAQVVEADKHGDKVLRLADGNFLKLFRRKRLISSAAFYPYAQRFADNASTLHKLGVPCPQIIGVHRITDIARDVVHYQPLPGLTLRQLISAGQTDEQLRQQLGSLIARLHDCGVYFRSLHLGNVVQTPEGELGLIDIADMKTQRRALNRLQRKRNFAHMLRYTQDRAWLLEDGGAQLCQGYRQASAMPWPPGSLEQALQQP